jgi:hypothetical protein
MWYVVTRLEIPRLNASAVHKDNVDLRARPFVVLPAVACALAENAM